MSDAFPTLNAHVAYVELVRHDGESYVLNGVGPEKYSFHVGRKYYGRRYYPAFLGRQGVRFVLHGVDPYRGLELKHWRRWDRKAAKIYRRAKRRRRSR